MYKTLTQKFTGGSGVNHEETQDNRSPDATFRTRSGNMYINK